MKKRFVIIILIGLFLVALPIIACSSTIVDSGQCGHNTTWTLDDTGLLTISGTGKMTSNPWKQSSFCYSINKVIIEDGVPNICRSAFSELDLTSIIIPNTVTIIEDSAFCLCSLSTISIPNSVTSIENWAFDRSGLTEISIPDSVIKLGYSAFSDCKELESIKLSNNLSYIDSYLFKGDSKLTSITIPESVTSIYGSPFEGCTGLTSIVIPKGVSYIDYSLFSGCYNFKRNHDIGKSQL